MYVAQCTYTHDIPNYFVLIIKLTIFILFFFTEKCFHDDSKQTIKASKPEKIRCKEKMALLNKIRRDTKKSSYYVWFLGAQESKGLRGSEYITPVLKSLMEREKTMEPFKITLQVSYKGLKIIQNLNTINSKPFLSKSDAKPEQKPNKNGVIKHFIPHHAVTCVHQVSYIIYFATNKLIRVPYATFHANLFFTNFKDYRYVTGFQVFAETIIIITKRLRQKEKVCFTIDD